jgi:ribosome-binding factor A
MKKKTPYRNNRVADQILKDVSLLIQQEIKDTRLGFVTLQHIELTADYAHAKIYVSVFGSEPQVSLAVLNSKAGYLHSLLFKMLRIHTIPKLKFIHDETQVKGFEMSQLIAKANKNNHLTSTNQDMEDKDSK